MKYDKDKFKREHADILSPSKLLRIPFQQYKIHHSLIMNLYQPGIYKTPERYPL